MSKNNTRWTANDDQILENMFNKYVPYKNIANNLNRTVDSVQARIVKKYIIPKFNEKNIGDNFDEFVQAQSKKYNIIDKDFERYLMYAGIKNTKINSDDSNSDNDSNSDDSDKTSIITDNSNEILEYLKILEAKMNILSRKIDQINSKL